MNVRNTVAFWQGRQATYPGELARGLREFSLERVSAGEECLAGTLIAAAERLEALEAPAPALPDRAELERRGAGGMSTDEGRELETVTRTRVQRRELYPFFESQR